MLSTTSLLLAAALAASLGAQVCHYNLGQDAGEQPGDTQRHGFFAESGSILGLRTQAIVPRFAFPNAPVLISSVFVAPAAYGYFRFASLQVKLGYTSRDALTTIFADNPAGSLTTVLDLREHTLWCRRSTWTEIGLQQPFLYVPAIGNLLIEVVAIRPDASPPPMLWTGSHANEQSVSASFAGTRLPTGGSVTAALPKLALCAERASLDTFGLACAGSGGTRPGLGIVGSARIGEAAAIWLSNAPALAPAVLFLSATNAAPYPLALDVIGMPGCRLYVSPDIGITTQADALGIANVPMPIPNVSSLVSSSVYFQFAVVDPTGNVAGLTMSNYGRALVGR